ncbi:MAG: HAMP domain-containing histidine kinase [Ruminiclostridium sp.]|nr:HAMP domain-containing histidine kinase [Ruminiclostridium sp.]
MLKRLRIKFVCINMTIVTILLCLVLSLVLHFTQENLETQSIRMMEAIAAEPFQPGLPDRKPDDIFLPYFTVHLDHQGNLVTLSGTYFDLSDQDLVAQLVAEALAGGQTGVLEDYHLRYCRVAAPMGEQLVFADISSEIKTMESLLRTCLLMGCLGFLAFLVISLFLARWAVRPVEKAWDQQRQFVADASHELKTPLTVITTTTELLSAPACPESHRTRYAHNILTTARQMRGLVESLLDLARADNGAARTDFSDLDYSQLVTSAVLPFEAVLFEAHLTLTTDIREGIRLKGSSDHLRQVVEILLDNARKYSFPQTQVTVTLTRTGKTCLLRVTNRGETISPADLTNIFKRFYRVDTARTGSGSYGLGLSIAESIVQAHKGKIWAESREGNNFFFVQLPCF